jgi:hypothetical protein
MAEQNRETLRRFFKAGERPTEQHFRDLIDSTLNMVDEGYRKTAEEGVKISTLGSEKALVSFYTQGDPNKVQWSIAYGEETEKSERKRLVFSPRGSKDAKEDGNCAITLDPGERVGVRTDRPQCELDVNGVLRSAGRIGGYKPGHSGQKTGIVTSTVPADGQPHDITGKLTGCQAFEIMAGVGGGEGKGRYALLHAVALNSYNNPRRPRWWLDWLWPQRGIRAVTDVYGSRCNKLELRWALDGEGYCLTLRSRCSYANKLDGPGQEWEGPNIQYSVTQLWFDPTMDGSKPKAG